MLKKIFALLFFFLCCQIGWTQRKPPMKWGVIDASEIQMKTFEADTSAEAVVLCNYGKISVEKLGDRFKYRFSNHKRIKVLKNLDFHHGKVSIPYLSYKKREWITLVKIQVFSPNGEKHVLEKKDIFFEKMNEYWSVAKAAVPNLQVGSLIEYRYEIVSDNLTELREWQFQEEIPTVYSELQVSYPQYYAYNYLFQGGDYMDRTDKDKVIVLEGENGRIELGEGWFVMENAVAMKEPERFITTMNDYVAKIRFQLNKIYYPDGGESSFLSTWEKLAEELHFHSSFGEQIFKKRNHKKILEAVLPLVPKTGTQTQKAQFLYNYFSENIEWNERYGGIWVKSTLDDAFEKKVGYYSEINLMLLAVLKELEITAYPILTSTRSHGKMYEKYPLVDQFNHIMIYAILDGKPIILDASDKLRPMGFPRTEALNGRGWIMDKKEQKWIDIESPKSREIFSVELSLDKEGTAQGTFKGAYTGYNAIPERRFYEKNEEGEHWIERLSEKYPEIRISDINFENLDTLNKPFKDKFKFEIPEGGQAVGDYIYFSPILYSNFDENIFKLEKRYYPVDIPYSLNEHYILKLVIPEDYVVEELPESARFVLPNKGGSFSFIIEQKDDGTIQLVSRILVQQLRFSPLEYGNIKELFDLTAEKYGEQIVLKKK